MLLIPTTRNDLAADFLILRLQERSIPYVRFNTEDFPEAASITIDNESGRWRWHLTLEGTSYADSAFTAVYLRHLSLGYVHGVPESDRDFVEAEVAETLRSLWRVIPDDRWLNHPRQVWLASNKVVQLTVAGELGLRIPRTVVSNCVASIRGFAKRSSNSELVAKAVKHGFTYVDGESVLAGTQAVSLADLDSPGIAKTVPIMIQDRVRKGFDVRVVVVGDKLFPVRIHSDVSPHSSPDWRLQQLQGGDLVHEPIELPATVGELCLRLVRHFGLGYSSMDFVEDAHGNFWFLELNPNGQWVWIEQLTGFAIRDAIVQALGLIPDSGSGSIATSCA